LIETDSQFSGYRSWLSSGYMLQQLRLDPAVTQKRLRYIELNPARAGMSSHPREHAWSSYRANAEGKPGALISPHVLYRALDKNEQRQDHN
jgi:hypothetical protein